MKSIVWIFCVALTLPHVGLSQGAPETRPLVPAEADDADPSERQLLRLEKAAQRYLDLANASTDQKATADFLRLYEEKEKAIGELRKQMEAERKCQQTLRAIQGWFEVAMEASDRAQQASNDAQGAAENNDQKAVAVFLKNAQEEDANAIKAREEAVNLMNTALLCVIHRPEAQMTVNRLEERRRVIAAAIESIGKVMK